MSRVQTKGLGVLCVAAAVLAPAGAGAQVPAGGEFQVNVLTTGTQRSSTAILGPDGRSVILWRDLNVGTGDVFGRRYDAGGAALGTEFRVNTYTSSQTYFRIAGDVDADGTFVVAWANDVQDGDGFGVFAQRHDGRGQPRGAEFQVNTSTTGWQWNPALSHLPDGGFVVAWQDFDNVHARRFDAAGAAQGPEFRVNSYTFLTQGYPVVAASAGQFVVAWSGHTRQGVGYPNYEIFAQRFLTSSGSPVGPEFQVNSTTLLHQYRPSIAVARDGSFVVAWEGFGDGDGYGIFAQRFDAVGLPLGAELRINSQTTGDQENVSLAADGSGNFVVAWESEPGPGPSMVPSDVMARRFTADGVPRSPEFTVNTYTFGGQGDPSLAVDAVGNFLVSWSSFPQDTNGQGVYAQRYGGLFAASIDVDPSDHPGSDGNGVLEACEEVSVRPAWRNLNGSTQSFTGAASFFTGPTGVAHTIVDGASDYGTVTHGATASCTAVGDCFLVSLGCPSSRPVEHWDARLVEDIAPDVQGQSKSWSVHVGESFVDVPRGHLFYRFVETLLHRGVTGGCGPGNFCPGESTTRAQLSVFALVAREGAGYLPSACGPTRRFADVPSASPFCAWIEELARRGVVTGCGGGNFCPGGAVSRAESAVFVLATLDPTFTPPACGTPVFGDVPAASPFCPWIEELARRGVVGGCEPGLFCPATPVTRGQMAVFLSGGFGLSLYGP